MHGVDLAKAWKLAGALAAKEAALIWPAGKKRDETELRLRIKIYWQYVTP